MGFLTREFQHAYKVGRPTTDVLSSLINQIGHGGTENLILLDLPKASDEVNREILWTVLYGEGLHVTLIRIIRM